jgi:ketosteroid isomerase-like protein
VTLDDRTAASTLATVLRLLEAVNRHDVGALVECFAEDYVNETPAHPARGFNGRKQVRRNWDRIFAAAPDTTIRLVSHSIDGARAWTELALDGTRADQTRSGMAGVVIFDVHHAKISAARFYLEPVEQLSGGVDDAIGRLTKDAAQGRARP